MAALETLLGRKIFAATNNSGLDEILTRVRPGAMMHSALLILNEEERADASAFLPYVESGYTDPKPFAADLFGDFWIVDGLTGGVKRVTTETVEIDPEDTFESLDAWAEAVMADPDVVVGESFAFAWEEENGRLADGCRLTGRVPFIMGGEYSLENVYPISFKELMAVRLHVGLEIRDLPDGARVMFETVD